MLFSLGYFGFYKQGCVCPIGSIQNVTMSIFNVHYAIPVTVMIFFLLPLAYSLFFGRVFCASVCALGAIQDLVVLKPIQLPKKVTTGLSMIPYIYLGTAVLLSATNAGMAICKYDPFIGFFRLNGHAPYLYLGAGFLLVGMFVARPYCRFFCPYGVLLGWMSRFARWHLSITPTVCIDCRLCEESCPFDAIDKPNEGLTKEDRHSGAHRLGYLFVMVPVLILLCGWIGYRMAEPLSRQHRTVALAEQIVLEKQDSNMPTTIESDTFRAKGQTEEDLFSKAAQIRSRMSTGGWLLGGFIGLVFGVKLINVSLSRTQVGYEVRKSDCYSCGRCCSYCPSDDMHRPNFVPGTPEFEASQAILLQPQAPAEKSGEKEKVTMS
jgi:ferredoxin